MTEDPDLPPAFRVLVTGSQLWPAPMIIVKALDIQLAEHPRLVVIHGDAEHGADRVAHNWIWTRKREGNLVDEVAWPANWGRDGRQAGHLRNWRMVEGSEPNLGLAFSFNDSPGTRGCIRCLRRAGVRTLRYSIDSAVPEIVSVEVLQ